MYEILQRDWEQYGPEEWERVTRALIGHECSHISHYDTVPQYMFMLGVQVGNHIYDWFVRIVYLLGRIIFFIPFIGPILGTLLVFLQRLLTELQVALLHKLLLPLQQLFHRVMSRCQEYRADRNGAQVSSPESMYTLLSFFARNSDMKGLRLFDSHPPVERRVLRQVRSMEQPQEKLTPRPYRKIVMGLMAAGQIAAVGFFGLFAAESAGLVTLGAVVQVEAAGAAIAHTAGVDVSLESVIDPDTLFAYLHPQRLWNTAPVQAGIASLTRFAEFQSSIAAVPRIAADAVFPSVQNASVRWLRSAAAWFAAIMAQVFVISFLYELVLHLFWRIEAGLRKSRINRSQETPLDFLLEIAVYTGNIPLARFALRHGAQFTVDPGEAPGRLSRYLRYYV